MTMSNQCLEIKGRLVDLINRYNEALKAKNLDDMTAIEKAIRDEEAEFAAQSQNDLFSVCKRSESPILEGVRQYTYPILKHKTERDGELITGMDLVDDREKQIDLVKLCKFCNLPYLWAYKVEKAGELLCIRTAKELGMTLDEIKRISKTYRMASAAQEVELGGTPTSNNQICKLLQKVIDDIIFEDDGNGKNKYKVNSHDVAYLLMCYTKRGRKQLSVTVAKASFLHGLIVDVLHRIVCGLKYGLEYQMVKDEKVEVVEDEPKKVSLERPEGYKRHDAPEVEDKEESDEESSEESEVVVIPRDGEVA